jgi:hypothetical protein
MLNRIAARSTCSSCRHGIGSACRSTVSAEGAGPKEVLDWRYSCVGAWSTLDPYYQGENNMRAFFVSIIALAAMLFAGGLCSHASASTWLAMSVTGDLANASSGLVVKVKKKKKHKDDDEDHDSSGQSQDGDSSLTTCTIQSGGGGGGCKTGFNYQCETLKNGKKCCGCVPSGDVKTGAPFSFYGRYAPNKTAP